MYKVCIYNNGRETVVHYPTADQEVPHLDKLPIKEGLSLVDSLSFSIYMNNPGYNSLFELTTKIKVIDTGDDSIRFTGRILDTKEKMNNSGQFYKEVTYEETLSYLNDSKTRTETYMNSNATGFLTQILSMHNNKIDKSKQIQVGNVDVIGSVTYTCNFKTTLESILEVKEKIGGDIRVRESNGVLYLDWLQSFSSNTVEIRLGVNMKDMVKGKDVTSLGTRIIPLGANNLTISSINGGLDYIEDTNAASNYGVIEKTVEYREIEDATVLKNACIADLSKYTQPLFLLESSALDLSYLTGNKIEQFALGTNLHIINPVMAIDSIYKIVALDLDLLQPYDPKLTIANFPIKLSTTINDLRKSSVQNNGVYNNVQVGDAFGIRAVRSDGKVTTTINATEGISIENDSKKVFTVDSNGNIVANDGTFNNIITNNMIANLARTSNTNNYIALHDQYMEFFHQGKLRMKVGFEESGTNAPTIKLYGESGVSGNQPLGTIVTTGGGVSLSGYWNFEDGLYLYSENTNVSTRDWVLKQINP